MTDERCAICGRTEAAPPHPTGHEFVPGLVMGRIEIDHEAKEVRYYTAEEAAARNADNEPVTDAAPRTAAREAVCWDLGGWEHSIVEKGSQFHWTAVFTADPDRKIHDFGTVPGGAFVAIVNLRSAAEGAQQQLAQLRETCDVLTDQAITSAERLAEQELTQLREERDAAARRTEAMRRRLVDAAEHVHQLAACGVAGDASRRLRALAERITATLAGKEEAS